MTLYRLASALIVLCLAISHGPAWAKPSVKTCKPCPADPLEISIQSAEAVVLGRVTRTLEPAPAKFTPGEGTIELHALQWLRHPKPLGRRPLRLTVHFSWDGACKAAPRNVSFKKRVIVFMNRAENGLWEALPGHCAVTEIDPSTPEGNLVELKKRLKKSSI